MLCSVVQAVQRCTVLCCAVLAVLCCAVLCCAGLGCAVLCCAVLCCAVLCCAVLCCAVLCCAGCAVLCCAVLSRTILCRSVLCCGPLSSSFPREEWTTAQKPAKELLRMPQGTVCRSRTVSCHLLVLSPCPLLFASPFPPPMSPSEETLPTDTAKTPPAKVLEGRFLL